MELNFPEPSISGINFICPSNLLINCSLGVELSANTKSVLTHLNIGSLIFIPSIRALLISPSVASPDISPCSLHVKIKPSLFSSIFLRDCLIDSFLLQYIFQHQRSFSLPDSIHLQNLKYSSAFLYQ